MHMQFTKNTYYTFDKGFFIIALSLTIMFSKQTFIEVLLEKNSGIL